MKKIAYFISIVCFGCISVAHSASSVKMFGGVNTGNTKTVENPSVARAGTVKSGVGMMKLSGAKITSGVNTGTVKEPGVKSSYADTERLAFNKLKTNSKTKSSGSSDSGVSNESFTALQNTVSELQTQLNSLSDSVNTKANTTALDDLQDALNDFENRLDDTPSVVNVSGGDDYINVDSATGKITINAETLRNDLGVQSGADAREVAMRNKDGKIQWRYTSGDDVKWKNLVNVEQTVESAIANIDITDIAENNTGSLDSNAYVYVLAFDPLTSKVDWMPIHVSEN